MTDASEPAARRRPRFTDLSWAGRAAVLSLAALAAVAVAGLLEAGLRVAGYGSSYPLFVRFEPASGYLVPNDQVGERYFLHKTDAAAPHADVFRAEQGPRDFLLFVQGASSAAGFPYYGGGAFSSMLEGRLQKTFPARRVQVVNLALGATNSYALLDMADEIAAREPDAVIVYAGHNEYYGVHGVASGQSIGRLRPLVRGYLWLVRHSRLVQLLRDGLDAYRRWRAAKPGEAGFRRRTLMQRLSEDQQVRYGSSLYEAGLRQLRANLSDLLARYRAAGIPVLIGTPASNLRDQPPFVGSAAGPDSARWRRLVAGAGRAAARGDTAASLGALDAAIGTDSGAADAFFRKARLLDGSGRHAAARRLYGEARDRDRLPFRAPGAVERILREQAAEHGARVVETEAALARRSPGGIVGGELMLEHVHPNVDGQFLLADAFYRALREEGLPEEWGRSVPAERARRNVPVTALDSAYAALSVGVLTAGWPFRSDGGGPLPTDTLRPSTRAEELALERLRGTMSWPRALHALRDHYAWSDYPRAIHVDGILARHAPFDLSYLLHARRMALQMEDQDRAAALFREAADGVGTSGALWLAGGYLASRGRRDQARKYFERAAALDPDDRRARAALQALRALPSVRRRAEENPDDPEAVTQLAAVYHLTAQHVRARETVERALELAPGYPKAEALSSRLSRLRLPSRQAGR